MKITDSQVHVFELSRPGRPWPAGSEISSPGTAHKPNGFSGEDLLAEMDTIGVDRAVMVPPSAVGFNNATCLEAAARHPDRLAVMGLFNPLAEGWEAAIESWLSQPGMLGFRLSFLPGFSLFPVGPADESFEPFWAGCERLGIPVMVNIPGQIDAITEVMQRHPDVTLIIDHMGTRGSKPTVDESFGDIDKVLALAALPRVYVKLTGAPRYSRVGYPFTDLIPPLRRLYDGFGPRRLMWGSDMTTMSLPYRESLDLFRKDLPFLSAEDKEWILSETLAEALGWPSS
jgi:predicted TIM-barrel fold metal-dependent hydrolase